MWHSYFVKFWGGSAWLAAAAELRVWGRAGPSAEPADEPDDRDHGEDGGEEGHWQDQRRPGAARREVAGEPDHGHPGDHGRDGGITPSGRGKMAGWRSPHAGALTARGRWRVVR
jgi:hypothetical protein